MLKNYEKINITVNLVIENKTYVVQNMDESDNISKLKREIEILSGIPSNYQCLFFGSEKIVLGYIYSNDEVYIGKTELEAKVPNGKFIDKSYEIMNFENKVVYLLNLRSYVENVISDEEYYSILTDSDNTFYNEIIRRYWPMVNISSYENIKNRIWQEPNLESQLSSIRNIFDVTVEDIEAQDGFTFTDPTELSNKIVSKFDKNQNLLLFFDQFQLNKRYYNIILKLNETKKYKRYIIGHTLSESDVNPPKNNGIVINNYEIYIKPDGTVLHENDEIIKENRGLFIGNIIDRKQKTTYQFTVGMPINLDSFYFLKLLNSYGSFIERDYQNFSSDQYISFYYKKLDLSNDNDAYLQSGSLIKIYGKSALTVYMSNIKSKDELSSVFNFIIRVLYTFIDEYKLDVSLGTTNIKNKSNQKEIDRNLFSDKNLHGLKYSRLCQKNKQPHGYIVDSPEYLEFINNPKNKEMLKAPLILDNHTYPNKKTMYVCKHKLYKHPTYISSLVSKNNICIPCCSSINKQYSIEYQKCNKNDNIVYKDSNNLYYLSKYNPEKIIRRKRLSYLPSGIHRLLNVGIKIKTFIAPNEDIYIISGMENSNNFPKLMADVSDIKYIETKNETIFEFYLKHGVFIAIIKIDDELDKNGNELKFPKFKIVNNYDTLSIIKNISTMPTYYFILTRENIYYPILHLTLSKERKYSTKYKHAPSSRITKVLSKILSKTVQGLESIQFNEYKQIKGSIENICNNILVNDELIYPISPRHYNSEYPIIVHEQFINTYTVVKKYEAKINNTFDLIYKDKFVGYELTSGLQLYFEPQKISLSKGLKKEIFAFPSENKELNKPFPTENNVELYNILLLYVSTLINTASVPNKLPSTTDEWNQILLKFYSNKNDPNFVSDYIQIREKKYGNLEIFKKLKINIMNNFNEKAIYELLFDAVEPYVNFVENVNVMKTDLNIRSICRLDVYKYTLTNQCTNEKFNISRKKYENYLRLIAHEIIHNKIKSKSIMTGTLPIMISSEHFSPQEGTKIIKI